MNDGMVIEDTVETSVHTVVDVVHEGLGKRLIFSLVLDIPLGMNLSDKCKCRCYIKSARLCNYFHPTPFGEVFI